MQERQINPDSFYEKETKEETFVCCAQCKDILFDVFYHFGYYYCNYCKVHVLKIK